MQQKTRLFNLRDVVHKEEAKPEHAIGLYSGKTVYLDILTTHTHLTTMPNVLLIVKFFITSPCIY